MSLSAGSRLGPYEVLDALGSGGMGEVYRARDTRLGREVALKVLPSSFSKDEDRLRRFEQEARAAGALNHPNVLSVYDVGRQDGTPYLVSELLEGASLRAVLRGAGLPLRKALDYAVQIARGLAAAHEKGIVHRDLKPENLFITRDGRAKILDFGLAKLVRPEGDSSQVGASTGTNAGARLGTVGYMSPEQVQELPADHRSDIFSFGAVLYEMLTGRRAFERNTTVETMSAILKEDPPEISEATPAVPLALERIVRRCLEKRPEERFHSSHDLSLALEAISGTSPTSAGTKVAGPNNKSRLRLALLGVGLVVLAIAAFQAGERIGDKPPASFQRLTFRRGSVVSARFAPDGQTVVYGAAWQGERCRLFSTSLASPESRALEIPEATILAISRAGEMALMLHPGVTDGPVLGTLARAHLTSGAPREVAEDVVAADWSPDGKDLAVVRKAGQRTLLEFPIGHVLVDGAAGLFSPRVSPGGDLVAFLEPELDESVLWIVDRGGRKRSLTKSKRLLNGLAWSPAGDEVWFTGGERFANPSLQAVSLSGKRRLVYSFPGMVNVEDIFPDGRVLIRMWEYQKAILGRPPGEARERDLSLLDGSRAMDLSADGRRLLFHESGQGGGRTAAVYLRTTDGASPAVRLGEGFGVALSPDGKWALTTRSDSTSDLFALPTGPGEPKVLHGGAISYWDFGAWLPDGRRFVINAYEPGHTDRFYLQSLDGPPRPLTPEGVTVAALSPDGHFLAALDAQRRIILYPVEGGEARTVPGPPEPGELGRFGADGQWIYATQFDGRVARVYRHEVASGRRELWKEITPADPAGVWLIEPIFTPDGSAYVYTIHRTLSSLYLVEGLR